MTATELSCGSCGTALNEKAKFCSECGAAVSAGTPPAEYKQVTVLFADVVHSMDIAAAVGAERLREIVAELVTRASEEVKRYDATVGSFTGDGIMAVLGAPSRWRTMLFAPAWRLWASKKKPSDSPLKSTT